MMFDMLTWSGLIVVVAVWLIFYIRRKNFKDQSCMPKKQSDS